MYSAYQNKEAKPNRVTDNRPTQYRDDDDEQMEYLALWKLNNPKGKGKFWPLVMLWLVGIVGTLCVVAYIRQEPIPQPAVAITFHADACIACHVPVIKNYDDYKKAHPSPAEKRKAKAALSDKHLLQNLIANTGANP